MKKLLFAIAFAAFASTTLAAVAGGPHDLTVAGGGKLGTYGTATAGTTPCQFCHTPHKANADATFATAPLWNRSALTGVTFTMYDGTKLTAGNTVDAVPAAASMTCLTCHEGSATLGTVYSTSTALLTPNTAVANNGMMVVGTNLNDDHPVSFLYPTAGVSGKFPAAISGVVAGFPLYNSKMECATCHDPHITGANFLRASAAAICGECHLDK